MKTSVFLCYARPRAIFYCSTIRRREKLSEKKTKHRPTHLVLVLSMPFLFQLSKRNVLLSVEMICRYFNE